MSNKVLVVGTVRNCSTKLRKVVKRLEKELLAVGREPEFFLVESDSDDGTVEQLMGLAKSKSNFRFVNLGILRLKIPERIQRIAFCRNVYLEELERLNQVEAKFDHLVVADFDEVNFRIQFPRDSGWLFSDKSIFTANQFGRYYDVLAVRADGWVEEDYRLSMQQLVHDGARPLHAFLQAVSNKQVHIQPGTTAFEVQSAFGGLAIYPAKVLGGLRYTPKALTETLFECEHVEFSKAIGSRGAKIMIAPSLRNKGSLRHTFTSNPLIRATLGLLSRISIRRRTPNS
jgi:hypothetical protein